MAVFLLFHAFPDVRPAVEGARGIAFWKVSGTLPLSSSVLGSAMVADEKNAETFASACAFLGVVIWELCAYDREDDQGELEIQARTFVVVDADLA